MAVMTIRAVLRLCRIPNVFTALANVTAGAVLARQGGFALGDLRLLAASALLYSAGMVLNDFFDHRIDAVERPERPIPSGQVPAGVAAALGLLLLGLGVALAASVSVATAITGALLAACILAYDGRFKGTSWGPVAMGGCRLLNVMLGLSAVWPPTRWAPLAVPAALIMGVYTAVITYLARDEVGGGTRARAQTGVAMMGALAVTVALSLTEALWGRWLRLAAAAPFAVLLAVRGRRLFAPLWRDAAPPLIGRAVGGAILLMPAVDAMLVAAAGHPVAAVVVLAFAAPAFYLKRWYYLT